MCKNVDAATKPLSICIFFLLLSSFNFFFIARATLLWKIKFIVKEKNEV